MLQRKKRIDYKDYKNPEENGNKNIVVMFVVALILIATLFAVQISQVVNITHLSYKTDELENKLNSLEESNKKLEIEVTKKISLSKIEKIAKSELGMVEAEEIKYIAINDKPNNNQKDEIHKENVSFVQGIQNFIEKLETVSASSP